MRDANIWCCGALLLDADKPPDVVAGQTATDLRATCCSEGHLGEFFFMEGAQVQRHQLSMNRPCEDEKHHSNSCDWTIL